MSEELMIKRDRMRFTKNTASSRLALLAIVLNVLFFVSIYKVNLSAYYTWLIGVSILYNLVFMLAAFLSSEGAKNYNIRYSFLLMQRQFQQQQGSRKRFSQTQDHLSFHVHNLNLW